MKAADIKPGITLYVRAKPGLPNGVRSRGGHVFNAAAEVEIHVVPNGTSVKHNEVSVVDAGLILADDALTVSDRAAFDLRADHAHLTSALRDATDHIAKQDAEIAELRSHLTPGVTK